MFGTVIRFYKAFYFEIEVEGKRTLGALSSPLIVKNGEHCDKAFKPGDRVELLPTGQYPSIIGAA